MRMRLFWMALACAALVGCSDASGPTVSSVAGVYHLTAMNGFPLPFTNGLYTYESGGLELYGDGTYLAYYNVRHVATGESGQGREEGDWTLAGSTVRLTQDGFRDAGTATVQGDALTRHLPDGSTERFER